MKYVGAQFPDTGKQVEGLPLIRLDATGKIESGLITNTLDDKARTELEQFLDVGAAAEGGIASN